MHLFKAETDTLKQGQRLPDWELLNSTGGVFRLGFLSLGSDSALLGTFAPRYIGIWFNSIPVYPVWVANPNDPIPDSSGVLTMGSDGILKIAYKGAPPIAISSNKAMRTSEKNITATLLDSGNFVIREVNSDGMAGAILWQSFDYPSNMLLPEMKLGINFKTGHEWYLSSWLSDELPSPGAFKLGLDPNGSSQLMVWRREEVYWRSGAWKNGSFELAPQITKRIGEYEFKFVTNENESYFSYSVKTQSAVLSRWQLESLGEITQFTLYKHSGLVDWIFETTSPCNTVARNSTAVCLNEKPLKCRKNSDYFEPRKGGMDVEGYQDYNASLALSDCHAECWKNCSCIAYRSASQNGTGCQFWTKESKFIPYEYIGNIYLLTSAEKH
ncbi:hypothetical protein Pint_20307 [Pistacia integerrima]|uniref:Uncharacterized protein n=1 Tax=Pistacia integerrima TaxID=434235 RepID=A0ACC0X7I8_9ROSI|nr:hypothetical protein Pint_20307 [Pistacia integerrima]